jgi:hypothetical protein
VTKQRRGSAGAHNNGTHNHTSPPLHPIKLKSWQVRHTHAFLEPFLFRKPKHMPRQARDTHGKGRAKRAFRRRCDHPLARSRRRYSACSHRGCRPPSRRDGRVSVCQNSGSSCTTQRSQRCQRAGQSTRPPTATRWRTHRSTGLTWTARSRAETGRYTNCICEPF